VTHLCFDLILPDSRLAENHRFCHAGVGYRTSFPHSARNSQFLSFLSPAKSAGPGRRRPAAPTDSDDFVFLERASPTPTWIRPLASGSATPSHGRLPRGALTSSRRRPTPPAPRRDDLASPLPHAAPRAIGGGGRARTSPAPEPSLGLAGHVNLDRPILGRSRAVLQPDVTNRAECQPVVTMLVCNNWHRNVCTEKCRRTR
jgi:hypothetical protein